MTVWAGAERGWGRRGGGRPGGDERNGHVGERSHAVGRHLGGGQHARARAL